MTVQERKTLEGILQSKLEDDVTVKQMRRILAALQESFAEMDAMASAAQEKKTDDLLQAFLQAKRVAGLSEKSLAHYSYILKRMLADEKVSPAMATVDHLRHWLASELERGVSENTLRGCRDAMSSCFGWLWREGLIQKNPCANLEPIKCPKLEKKPFDSVEIELIKEACDNLRDKAIVCFLLATGCRVSEAVQLNRNDIDFVSKEVTVFGKGAKERTVYLDDVAADILKRYLASRTDDSVALFPGRASARLQPNGVRAMLKKLEKTSGVPNIHPHRFRRTFATNLSRRGMAIEEIQKLLGHKSLNTTLKYVCTDNDKVKMSYKKYSA